jgi:hypothetical protein
VKTSRLAGVILIGAAVVMAAGAAIGFLAPSLRDAPWTDDPQIAAVTIAGNPDAYALANGLFMAAAILTTLGLVPASLGFKGRSRPWAWMALVSFAFAAVFESVDRTISMQIFTWAAQQDFQLTDPTIQAFIRFQGGLSDLFHILGFLAISLYGIAMLQSPGIREAGWIFVIGGLLGIVLQVIGGVIPAFVFLGTAALGTAIWLLDRDQESDP